MDDYADDRKNSLKHVWWKQYTHSMCITVAQASTFCIFSEMPCGSIPKVANAQIEGRKKEIYEPGETIRYQCDAGFLIVGPPEIICREGNWTAPPFCDGIHSTSK